MRKYLLYIGILSLLFCIAFTGIVSAEEVGYAQMVNAATPAGASVSLMNAKGGSLQQEIYAALVERRSELDIRSYNLTLEEAKAAFYGVILEHPELFYVKTAFEYTLLTQSGRVGRLIFEKTYAEYAHDAAALQEKADAIEAEVERICDSIDEGLSDAEKALLVHDWFVLHYEYDTPASKQSEPLPAHRIDGLFLDKKAVCQGYSLGYIYVLDRLGIEAVYVSSDSMNHAWNMVQIGEDWYHVDVTGSDPLVGNLGDVAGYVTHENFLRSDAGIAETGHGGWETALVANADYSDSFWKKENGEYVSGGLFYKGGKWYYIDGDDIVSYDRTNREESIVRADIPWKWQFGEGGPIFGINISLLEDRIFYNTPVGIYCMALDGSDHRTYRIQESEDDIICGMLVDGRTLLYDVTGEDLSSVSRESEAIKAVSVQREGEKLIVRFYKAPFAAGKVFFTLYDGQKLSYMEIKDFTGETQNCEFTLDDEKTGTGTIYAWSGLAPLGGCVPISLAN